MRCQDYSHIKSRLYQSYSKSKSKNKIENYQVKSVKQSLEKIQQLSENHYKKAMKHVNKKIKLQKDIQ